MTPMERPKSVEKVKYQFTAAELRELGERLARTARRIYELEKQKSEVAASLGAEIKTLNHECARLAECVEYTYEIRDMECAVLFDAPRPGRKLIVRPDTGEPVREDDMTPAEKQRTLEFDPNAPKN